jgi:predicted nucleic acid-binding protein
VLTGPELGQRFPAVSRDRVELILARLRFVADHVRASRVHFDFPRDPKDEKFIELAIAGRATHIVTTDHDLLDLADRQDDASKRFRQRLPRAAVITPAEFVNRHGHELSLP